MEGGKGGGDGGREEREEMMEGERKERENEEAEEEGRHRRTRYTYLCLVSMGGWKWLGVRKSLRLRKHFHKVVRNQSRLVTSANLRKGGKGRERRGRRGEGREDREGWKGWEGWEEREGWEGWEEREEREGWEGWEGWEGRKGKEHQSSTNIKPTAVVSITNPETHIPLTSHHPSWPSSSFETTSRTSPTLMVSSSGCSAA